MKVRYIIVFVIAILFSSCLPIKRTVLLKDESEQVKLNEQGNIIVDPLPYKVKIGDELLVKILTEDPNIAKYLGTEFVDNGIVNTIGSNANFTGRIVDEEGYINIPRLGKIYVKDKDFKEISVLVKNSLAQLYRGEVNVKVDLNSYTYNVVGEGGSRVIKSQRRLNLVELFATAGINAPAAKLNKIRIFKKENDSYRTVNVNMNQLSTMNNNEFYLDNNDIVMIDPVKSKNLGVGTGTALSTITTITGFIMSMVGFYYFIKNI